MRRLLSVLMTAAATVGLGLSSCSKSPSLNPLELELRNRLGCTNCVLGTTFAEWTNVLGHPSVVKQRDEGNTFFYWPDQGIGVFCHPLYRGQYRFRSQPSWVVTSIFVPLHTNVHPRIPPVDSDTRIGFTKLLFDREEVIRKQWTKLHKVEAFQEAGVLESLEIRKPDSWLGDYD